MSRSFGDDSQQILNGSEYLPRAVAVGLESPVPMAHNASSVEEQSCEGDGDDRATDRAGGG